MLLYKVRATIKKYGLISKDDRILIGISGGPDSITLLYALLALKKEMNLSIHLCHLDHMLRKGSSKDCDFVRQLAARLKIPATCGRFNVKKLSSAGSLEEVARKVRLSFFFSVGKKIKATKIALGHNLDDQAETVLMRLIRGAGLYGISGILPKRRIGSFEIIRPLIETRRSEIESFLKRRKIKPLIDETNAQDIYFRNRIRNDLLPLLEKKYNRNIKTVLSTFAQSACYDYDYLARESQKFGKRMGRKIRIRKFLKLHPAIQRLILRSHIKSIKGDMRAIGFQHILEIEDLINNRPVNSIVDLPKKVSVVKAKDSIIFYRR